MYDSTITKQEQTMTCLRDQLASRAVNNGPPVKHIHPSRLALKNNKLQLKSSISTEPVKTEQIMQYKPIELNSTIATNPHAALREFLREHMRRTYDEEVTENGDNAMELASQSLWNEIIPLPDSENNYKRGIQLPENFTRANMPQTDIHFAYHRDEKRFWLFIYLISSSFL